MDTPTYLWLLERSRNQIGCWKGQGIKWVCPLLELIQAGGISSTADELLASIFVNRTVVTTVAKYDQCSKYDFDVVVFSFNCKVPYGPWWNHYMEFWEKSYMENILMITYEELQQVRGFHVDLLFL